METIHLKTLDPVSQELLRSAARRGLDLVWERFEKSQPQDGFQRLGLSCPFGCLQGPCRIDPFERGAKFGICGLGRHEMVAATLLRICQQGALEALAGCSSHDHGSVGGLNDPLWQRVAPFLSDNGVGSLHVAEIFGSSRMLQLPSGGYRAMVRQAVRLALLTLGLIDNCTEGQPVDSASATAGYGVAARNEVVIGIGGRPREVLLIDLVRQAALDPSGQVRLVSLGEWLLAGQQFLPILCTTGESELAVISGAVRLLVAGPGTSPSLVDLCRKQNIPVVFDHESDDSAAIVAQACKTRPNAPAADLTNWPDTFMSSSLPLSERSIGAALSGVADGGLALVGGQDSADFPHGQLPVELAAALADAGVQVVGWGDAATWMIKNGLTDAARNQPAMIAPDARGVIAIVKALAAAGSLDRLRGICFTGLHGSQDLGIALGLAALGCRVCLATPAPISGSAEVVRELADQLAVTGGSLTCFDHPPLVQELLSGLLPA